MVASRPDLLRGSADWEKISEIKQHLKKIPLIGNGDLDSHHKVIAAFQKYAVDGVMIAAVRSAGLGCFNAVAAATLRGEPIPPEPTLDEQRRWMLKHYELVCERLAKTVALLMRKFACNYAQGKAGARLTFAVRWGT